MSKPASRAYSRVGRDAAEMLGHLIRHARIGRRMTVAELAERAGVSRGLVQRTERGDMGCAIGAVFEIAAIVGVPLFNMDPEALASGLDQKRETMALIPKSVRQRIDVSADNDF